MLTRSKRTIALIALGSLTLALASATTSLATLAAGTVGSFYTFTVPPQGSLPDSFSLLLGSLPPGLTLNPNTGVISGTPNASGQYTFTIAVYDSTQVQTAVSGEVASHTKGMATQFQGNFGYSITINPGASGPAGAPMSPAALALLMLGLAAAGIFRVRQQRQS